MTSSLMSFSYSGSGIEPGLSGLLVALELLRLSVREFVTLSGRSTTVLHTQLLSPALRYHVCLQSWLETSCVVLVVGE